MAKITIILPPKQEKAFREAVARGSTLVALAERFAGDKKRHPSVRRWLKERNLELVSPTKERDEKIKALWETDTTRLEIAKLVGLSDNRIYRLSKELGLPQRPIDTPNFPWSAKEDRALKRLRLRGAKFPYLAETWTSHGFPPRSQQSLTQRAQVLGIGRAPPRAPLSGVEIERKIEECLEKHGNSPAWRLGDYADIRDPRVLYGTLKRMRRKGKIAQLGAGLYALPPSAGNPL